MSEDQQVNVGVPRFTQELIDWLTKPVARFLRIEAAAGSVRLLFTIAALVLSNSPWVHPFLEIGKHRWGLRSAT